jgi:hypothetical protein
MALTGVASLVLVSIVVACGGTSGEPGAVGTTGDASSTINVRITGQFVAVENRSGSPLNDVQVTIIPTAGTVRYEAAIPRLEPGEARNVALDSFRGANGVTLNRMFVRPREVTVRATDQFGKALATSVPWAG